MILFAVSLLVMSRWILQQQSPNSVDSTLPSAYDAVMPLIAMTVASAAFPVGLLAIVFLMRVPEPTKSGSEN
ncbi:MAG: hypothetical protein KDN19_05825 [Verrucomicrobiae bacterium]|nr:hypothetical protein [Verrucomicrobiae bacterium]